MSGLCPSLSKIPGGGFLRRGFVVSIVTLSLSACAAGDGPAQWLFPGSAADAEPTENPDAAVVNELSADTKTLTKRHDTQIIDALKARNSVVPKGSTEAAVVGAVMEADTSASAAQLRAAVLRAEARDKNWLPSVDPKVSLLSLGSLAGAVLADMILFDNGRKRQERAYAHADIDVAAVALSENRNTRIRDALKLQIAAAEAREKSRISAEALTQMTEYRRILNGRVSGGVDKPSDLVEMDRLLAELRAESESEKLTLSSSRNQLGAMTAGMVSDPPAPSGLAGIKAPPVALPVLEARAAHRREVAELDMARAQMLPTLAAGTSANMMGVDGALNTGGSVMIFGRKAEYAAIEARTRAAADKVKTVEEDTARELQRYADDATSYRSASREARAVAEQIANTHRYYNAQFRGGQRGIMDVANIYMTMITQRKLAIGQHYRALDADVVRAGELGVLLDGDRI